MINFENIKRWYDEHKWTKAMVRNAVKMNAITKAQYKEITGEDY